MRQIRENIFSLNKEPFDPIVQLEQICSIFQHQAEIKGVNIIHQIYDNLGLPNESASSFDEHIVKQTGRSGIQLIPKLYGDRRRFKQVVINLIKNAIKFTTKGTIEVKASYRKPEGLLLVHIKDTGSGIRKEEIPKLFNRFGKLQRTADQNKEGIGLGLVIAKSIVEQQGGEIGVESAGEGFGSTFKFSLF